MPIHNLGLAATLLQNGELKQMADDFGLYSHTKQTQWNINGKNFPSYTSYSLP